VAKQSVGKVVKVTKAGLAIIPSHPYLAASSDGLVEEDGKLGLLEIKHVLTNSSEMLQEASKCRKNFCLPVDINGELKLNKKHVFFYQVQGQMQAYDRKGYDFLIR
jgi:hypothetical protein